MHFVQEGELEYATSHGIVVGRPGDFVCIPRAIEYRVRPLRTPTLRTHPFSLPVIELRGSWYCGPVA